MKTYLKKPIAVVLTLLLVICSLPFMAFAENTASLHGYLFDDASTDVNIPLEGITVNLEDASRAIVATTTTDSTGKFEFTSLNPGNYYAVIPSGAYYPYQSEYFIDTPNGFYMIAEEGKDNSYFKLSETGVFLKQTLGDVILNKYETGTTTPVGGATYALYHCDIDNNTVGDAICSNNTDSNGSIVINDLPYGKYCFIETASPDAYFLNDEPIIFSITQNNATVYVTANDLPHCSVIINKTDGNSGAALQNVGYNICKMDGTVVASVSTNMQGSAFCFDLEPGNYYVVETSAADNYILDETHHNFTVSVTSKQATLNLTNNKFPLVSFEKLEAETDVPVAGAELQIKQGDNVVKTFTSVNGSSSFLLAPGDYTLVESSTPAGFVTAEPVNFTVTLDVENTVKMYDEKITAEFIKYGETENGAIEYNGLKYDVLSGATFELVNNLNTDISYTWVSGDAAHSISAIPAGTYTLTETITPNNYKTMSPQQVVINETSNSQIFNLYNELETYPITLEKVDTDDNLLNASFTLTGPFGVNENIDIGRSILNLKSGTYTLTETEPPAGFAESHPIIFTIDENGVATINGTDIHGVVSVVNYPIVLNIYKVDKDNRNLISGATLRLTKDDNSYSEDFTANGDTITIDEGLVPGSYTLTEIVTPNGYATADPIHFVIDDSVIPQSVTMEDTMLTGSISITKIGQIVDNIERQTGYSLPSLPGSIYELLDVSFDIFETVFKTEKLENVEFSLYANEDIYHPDGKTGLLYAEDALIETKTTDALGNLVFDNLPFGTYRVVETKTLNGFVLDSSEYIYSIDYEHGSAAPITDTLTNNRKVVTVNIHKTDPNGSPLKNAYYVLKDISSGIDTACLITDENGNATYTGVITPGKYVLIEVIAPLGFLTPSGCGSVGDEQLYLEDETFASDYIVDFSPSNPNYNPEANNMTFSFNFVNQPNEVVINKLDKSDNSNIVGAKLSLINAETKVEYTSWYTDGSPKTLTAVPDGVYILRETETPAGYVTADDMNLTIFHEDDNPLSYTMYDERVTGSITIKKTVANTTTVLPGVTFSIKDITNNIDYGFVVTGSDGSIKIKNLPVANYKNGVASDPIVYSVVEISAPNGIVVNSDAHFVTLNVLKDKGNILTDAVLELENEYTTVNISKQDITSKTELPGAKLSVYAEGSYDENNNIIDDATPLYTWISSDTPYVITGIVPGKYLLVEETAPDGYFIAESVAFEVKSITDVQPVVMYNDYTKVSITKIDIATGELLSGALLSIYRAEDIVNNKPVADAVAIESWESEVAAHIINGLAAGNYVLFESKAPNGYLVAKPVSFSISNSGDVVNVVISDEAIETTINSPLIPKTNDGVLIGSITLGVLMITGLSVTILKRKRK